VLYQQQMQFSSRQQLYPACYPTQNEKARVTENDHLIIPPGQCNNTES